MNDYTKQRLTEIHAEMQDQIYGKHVEMGECNSADFVFWFNWRMAECPQEIMCDLSQSTLAAFDIESAVSLMAEWIKAPLQFAATDELKPHTKP